MAVVALVISISLRGVSIYCRKRGAAHGVEKRRQIIITWLANYPISGVLRDWNLQQKNGPGLVIVR